MKKLFAILICLLLLGGKQVFADTKIELLATHTTPSDSENIVQAYTGIQLNAIRKNAYILMSLERIPIRLGGQRGADIKLIGIGFGINRKINDWLSVFVDIGYYHPDFSENGKMQTVHDSTLAEGVMIYLGQHLCDTYPMREFDAYSIRYSGNVGGKFGIAISHELSKRWKMKLLSGYRYLRLEEYLKGQDYGDPSSWQYRHDRDFSGWQIGGTIEFSF